MGVTTAIMLGLTTLSAMSSMSNANKEAKAAIAEGNIVAANKAKETKLKAARLQTSFLNSGLTLEGTPMAAIDDTFSTGLADIGQISSNYNNKAKSAINKGRSQALSGFASAFMGMGMSQGLGGLNEMFGGATSMNPAAASVWEAGSASGAGFYETLQGAKTASFLNPV